MNQRCLLIADDLTGGGDAGAQFAKMGLCTLLISLQDDLKVDFSDYRDRDVLVVNTDSRGRSSENAFFLISGLLKDYDNELFPILYKKIDSTLRGNIGYEIDAILKETDTPICFLAPSYPGQNRTLVDGIMRVGGKPLALTEVARDTASPVRESRVSKLLQHQSRNSIGWIGLSHVASSFERLKKAVEVEQKKGNRIIIFDAVSRQDLRNIVGVAFSVDRRPLFVGSAGLAEEVAKKLSPSDTGRSQPLQTVVKPVRHIFIISGSASSVTHQQLKRLEERRIPAFGLNHFFLTDDFPEVQRKKKEFSFSISNALSKGHVILKTTSDILPPKNSTDLPIHLKITKTLAAMALMVLEESGMKAHDLALILTGGDTAQRVINALGVEGIEIEGELLEGIVKGHLLGGNWDGLTVITKAGAFGKENALEKIVKILETGSR
jgi:uncharacterized protein YgbK (DUF1537 family)